MPHSPFGELTEYVCLRVGKICNVDITGDRETVTVSSGWEVMECLVVLADLVNCKL